MRVNGKFTLVPHPHAILLGDSKIDEDNWMGWPPFRIRHERNVMLMLARAVNSRMASQSPTRRVFECGWEVLMRLRKAMLGWYEERTQISELWVCEVDYLQNTAKEMEANGCESSAHVWMCRGWKKNSQTVYGPPPLLMYTYIDWCWWLWS